MNVEASNSRSKPVKMSKGKSKVVKSDTNDSSSDTDTDANTDDESTDSDMMEMVAMLVKSFQEDEVYKGQEARKVSEEIIQC